MKNLLFFAIFLPLLCGCSPGFLVRNNNYKSNDVAGRKLLIVPIIEDSIKVLNVDDVEDDFSTDKRKPQLVLRDSLYKALRTNKSKLLANNIKLEELDIPAIKSLSDSGNILIIKDTIERGNVPGSFYVPKKEWIAAQGKEPDMALVLTFITFGRDFTAGSMHYSPGVTVSTPTGPMHVGGGFTGGGGTAFLGAEFGYIIYDYKKDKWISFGVRNLASPFLFGMTKSDWDTIFKGVWAYCFPRQLWR